MAKKKYTEPRSPAMRYAFGNAYHEFYSRMNREAKTSKDKLLAKANAKNFILNNENIVNRNSLRNWKPYEQRVQINELYRRAAKRNAGRTNTTTKSSPASDPNPKDFENYKEPRYNTNATQKEKIVSGEGKTPDSIADQLNKAGVEGGTGVTAEKTETDRLSTLHENAQKRQGTAANVNPNEPIRYAQKPRQKIGNLFSKAENNIVSFDIETLGLDEKKDPIWSMGTAGKGGKQEHFITMPDEEIERFKKTNIFNIEGYHDPYLKAVSEGKTKDVLHTATSIIEALDKDSIVLIQNVHFEDRRIANVINNTSGIADLEDKFEYIKENNKGKLLRTPPKVTQARHEAARQQALMRGMTDSGERKEALKNINSVYNNIMAEYVTEISRKNRSGAIVMELMDVSTAVYGLAAERNLLSDKSVMSGRSVDFLKQSLFSGKGGELHWASEDAEDQRQILKRLSGIYEELESGKISDKTKSVFTKIRSAQPYNSASSFMSSMRSTLEEIKRDTTTKRIDPLGIISYDEIVNGVKYRNTGLDYQNIEHVKPTSDPREARNFVVERFMNSGVEESGIDMEKFSASIDDLSLDEQIAKIKEQEDIYKNKSIHAAKTGEGVRSRTDYAGMLKNIKHKKLIALGVGATAVIAASGNSGGNKYEQQQKEMAYARSNDRTFEMYSQPVVHHGTGLYAWENITGHSRY
ncbi:MAG: hypothetical protein DRQ78_04845 [Epsilonproteobacteria bacterium]|nr:MAG: hypothetical protein DRQ78_04845 [Campylobacterota bacterium]